MKRKLYRRLFLTPWPTYAWVDGPQSLHGPSGPKGQMTKKPSRSFTGQKPLRMSAYGRALRTRRQLCMLYGNLRARTYRLLEGRAYKAESLQVEMLFRSFEKRLASCLLRTNCFASFEHIRAFLRQGHIRVNNRVIHSSGYMCQPGDVLSFPVHQLPERQKKGCFLGRPPLHLEIDYSLGQAIVLFDPSCAELPAHILASEE